MKEIDLKNPIFVYYADVDKISTHMAQIILNNLKKELSYTNITFWIVPSNHNKIECVYDGHGINYSFIRKLRTNLNKLLGQYTNEKSLIEVREEVRNLVLTDLLE